MFVSGFTIVRNAIKYDYPVVEAIQSILPLCDEIVVAVGNSEDDTMALIKSISSEKIRIIETVWDDTLRQGGHLLAVETNKAKEAIHPDADWAFYIQADECFHEDGIKPVLQAMKQYQNDEIVDGLLFKYLHFYGSYDYTGDSRKWYRNEIRIIKNKPVIHSYLDAQGFRKDDDQKLNVKAIDAFIYHYGWVKHPEHMMAKQQNFHRMWHDDAWVNKNIPKGNEFDYSSIDSLEKFNGTHPKVMRNRTEKQNWSLDFNPHQKNYSLSLRFLHFIEKKTGWRIGEYKNYKEI